MIMKRNWAILMVGLIIASIIGYNYIYQDHRDIENETAAYTMSAAEIAQLFSDDTVSAEQQFLNKTIEVSGLVSEVLQKELTLENKVFCQFSTTLGKGIEQNSKVKIKGRVIGYDDLLEQIKLDQCSIID